MGRHAAPRGSGAPRTPAPQTPGRHAARGWRLPRRRDLASLGALSLLTGLVVGWQPPLFFASTSPAAASVPTVTPSAVASPSVPVESAEETPVAAEEESADVPADPAVFIPEDQRRTITIAGAGDILVHRELIAQAKDDGGGTPDFGPQVEGIRPLIEGADLAVCHMEYPLGTLDGPWTAWPDLPNAPPQIAQAVADIGFDACTTASNHTLDQGFDGVVTTIDALRAAGLDHAGSAASEAEADRITMIDVQGVTVALLSYTYSFNGIPRPYDWCCDLVEPGVITAEAQRARAEGAQIVVVSLHHGYEGVVSPAPAQREVVQELADSGAVDLVLGHHAHVVQPVTRVGDMWVAYGHGNMLSAQSRKDPRTGDGLITSFTFAEQADGTFTGIEAIGYAVTNQHFPFRLVPVTTYDGDEATWARVSEQAMIPGDTSGFRLVRLGAES